MRELNERTLVFLGVIAIVGIVFGLTLGPEVFQNTTFSGTTTMMTSQHVSTVTQFQTATVTVAAGNGTQILEVCFSPDKCDLVIKKYFDLAQKSIYVAIYSFTLDNLADSLVNAKTRGVLVQVVFDKIQVNIQGSQYQFLISSGIQVKIDRSVALMHNKIAIIDGLIVIQGSMNWSNNGKSENRENILVIQSVVIAVKFKAEWDIIWSESTA